MQKNSFGLLGAGVMAVIVGLGLYWNAKKTEPDTTKAGVSAPAASGGGQQAAQPQTPQTETPPAQSAAAAPKADKPTTPAEQAAVEPEQQHQTPIFDVLRVEPDGSVVIAGKAMPNSDVEVVAGASVLGKAKAGPNGDFVVVLDDPLKPGDHQLVLRASGQDKVATSAQTAIVSVPDSKSGQVLALVEEPGAASRLITKPEAAPAQPADSASGPSNGAATAPTPGESSQAKPAEELPIAIEAVEIEGDAIFVAGNAKGGNRVIVHANDILIGSSAVSPEGRFLVQSTQPLAVADYIIRADLLDNANRIVATARVPFRREAGANISAVAPAASGAAPAEAGAEDKAALQKVDGSVIIRRGDNLWTISKRAYGKGTRYTTIYLANREQIRNPDLIWPGQVFHMPKEPLGDEEVKRQRQERQN
ncbi:Ig-like domain-containing protein [Ochrobactrum teleogrylli]|uniref:LysM peptidoglycan-binding domain-containing protein n=1 Tax=Ochrobactrum teleogrylli TaxID=2479765 RepID=A0ABY2Y4F2_9HYPH|nr:Ig-like domain-containing protein [[Ochrobactrum] teleogrylli]TNV13912.1 LysM peptidoglycan-binding domain-containing protein [[Ochrobactrum] teleogrylli]